jgi:hypothetical protein
MMTRLFKQGNYPTNIDRVDFVPQEKTYPAKFPCSNLQAPIKQTTDCNLSVPFLRFSVCFFAVAVLGIVIARAGIYWNEENNIIMLNYFW